MPLGTMVVALITADRIGFLGAMGFAKTEDPEGVTFLRDWSFQGFLRPDSGLLDLAAVVFGICLLGLLARGHGILSIDGLFRLIWGGDEGEKLEKKPEKPNQTQQAGTSVEEKDRRFLWGGNPKAPRPIVTNRYIHPLKIRDLVLANNLTLAPMAGFTNVAFRLIAKEVGGCGLVATEMVAALGNPGAQNADRFRILTQNVPQEKPLAMQVYGREPDLCAATAAALDAAGADLIDLNCGCPVKKAKQSGCGVALMKEPQQVGAVVKAMRAAVPHKPVTVKMRLGFDARNRNMLEVAQEAIENGADALFVHARTGESKHGVPVDLSGIREVKELALKLTGDRVPVLANGSMETAAACRAAKDEAMADGYQIGRAACGDPWLFRNLITELTESGTPYRPTYPERRALLLKHFELILELFGEERGVRVMRKYTFFYCNGLPGVRKFRDRFMRISSRTEFLGLVDDFFLHLEGGHLDQEPIEHLKLYSDEE